MEGVDLTMIEATPVDLRRVCEEDRESTRCREKETSYPGKSCGTIEEGVPVASAGKEHDASSEGGKSL